MFFSQINKVCILPQPFDQHINNTYKFKYIPDHLVLTLKFDSIIQSIPRNSAQPQRNIPVQNNNAYDPNHIYFKRFNVNPLPEEFLNNETSQVKLLQLIQNIEQVQQIQTEIDNIYIKLCTLYHEEMNSWLRSKNVHLATHKRFKRCTKPFWNNHLTTISLLNIKLNLFLVVS